MSSLLSAQAKTFNEIFLHGTVPDANTMLLELDRDLHSNEIGKQCSAIVRYSHLLELYPFPIVVNSCFLKLAMHFFRGSHLMRYWVVRMCQQSEHHLDKIININVFVEDVFKVHYASDPLDRALTLRMLGAVSRVMPDEEKVYHFIRGAVCETNAIEVTAAIYAIEKFAAKSGTFANSMYAKISDMISSLSVPMEKKLQLIPVLKHMHHDGNITALVCELCKTLLPQYPRSNFVVVVLETMTELCARAGGIAVPKQVSLLLQFLHDEQRPVRLQVLKSLSTLAKPQCVHSWPKSDVVQFIKEALTCKDSHERGAFLKIAHQLFRGQLVWLMLPAEQQCAVLRMCGDYMSGRDLCKASEAVSLLATLVKSYIGDERLVSQIKEIMVVKMEELLLYVLDNEAARDLRKILTAGVRIAVENKDFSREYAYMLVDIVCYDVGDEDDDMGYAVEWSVASTELLCEALASLSSHLQLQQIHAQPTENAMEVDDQPVEQTSPVFERLTLILRKLNKMTRTKLCPRQLHSVELMWVTVLQTLIGNFVPLEVLECLDRTVEATNCWTQYRIARSASRYGLHFLAARLYMKIADNTAIDKLHFFIMALAQLSQAESILTYKFEYDFMSKNYEQCDLNLNCSVGRLPLIKRLGLAIQLYCEAMTSMRASSSPSNPLTFQLTFIKLRVQLLQVLHIAAQFLTSPHSVAGSALVDSEDYLIKFGRITHRLRKLHASLEECAHSQKRFCKSAFDVDPVSLEFLKTTQHQCDYLASVVGNICFAKASQTSNQVSIYIDQKHPETLFAAKCCRRLEELGAHLPVESEGCKTIGRRHLDVIAAQIELLANSPNCMPRYFFQALQTTEVKLSTIPKPQTKGQPVELPIGSDLVIQVEGVVQQFGKKQSRVRCVNAVKLTLFARPDASSETEKPTSDAIEMTQTVKLQREFFSGSFLLHPAGASLWKVSINAHVVDELGITWSMGIKESMKVSVIDGTTECLS